MDIDTLISFVYQNKCLWDAADKNYNNQGFTRRKWMKVAGLMNTTGYEAKKMWVDLRRTFLKELNKSLKKRNGDDGENIEESEWPYFKSMYFLKWQFGKTYKLHGNVPTKNGDIDRYKDYWIPSENELEFLESTNRTKRIKQPKAAAIDKETRSTGEDPDYLFLMSLLPYLRKIPDSRKMAIRTKLQQVFEQEI